MKSKNKIRLEIYVVHNEGTETEILNTDKYALGKYEKKKLEYKF